MNDATINPDVRNKVLRVASDAIAERNKLTRFFRYNAQAKHGVPQDPNDTIEPQTVEVQRTVEVPRTERIVVEHIKSDVAEPTTPQPVVATSDTDPWKKAAMVLGSAAALVTAGTLGWWAAGTKPPESQSTPAVERQEVPQYQSPLQYLEDRGEHLP